MAVSPIIPGVQGARLRRERDSDQKIPDGMPNYGYDWTLPYRPGSAAESLSNPEAARRAAQMNAAIQYSPTSQAPYYYYQDKSGARHEVWFDDARSVEARLRLVSDYDLGGVSYWTVNEPFPQTWLVLQSRYDIEKVL